jgi:hypothetical protein
MHNDIYHTQEQNICQAWSKYLYRVTTGIGQRFPEGTGTLLPKNLCTRQVQNVALVSF